MIPRWYGRFRLLVLVSQSGRQEQRGTQAAKQATKGQASRHTSMQAARQAAGSKAARHVSRARKLGSQTVRPAKQPWSRASARQTGRKAMRQVVNQVCKSAARRPGSSWFPGSEASQASQAGCQPGSQAARHPSSQSQTGRQLSKHAASWQLSRWQPVSHKKLAKTERDSLC